VCPRFFRGPQDPDFRRADEQPETIAHEMGHRFVGARGEVYSRDGSARIQQPGQLSRRSRTRIHMLNSRELFSNIGSRSAAPASQTATPPGGGGGGAVQRKALRPAGPVSTPEIIDEALHSPGEPLDAATRTWMEPRFGRDFSDVRNTPRSERCSVCGRDQCGGLHGWSGRLCFGAGSYQPQTKKGARLLAHELTHVAQQANGSDCQTTKGVSHPSDAAEVEAESAAAGVMSGNAVPVTQAPSAALHTLSPGETAGLIAGGAVAVGAGFGIAALLGAFESSKFDKCTDAQQKKALAAMKTARGCLTPQFAGQCGHSQPEECR